MISKFLLRVHQAGALRQIHLYRAVLGLFTTGLVMFYYHEVLDVPRRERLSYNDSSLL